MKRYLLAILLAGCTDKADIGMNNQPVTCQPTAKGVVNGSVTNKYTNKTYSFGTVQASFTGISGTTGNNEILLDDSELRLQLMFQCPTPITAATYDPSGGQGGCPLSVIGLASGNQQEIWGNAGSGEVIVDQTTGCIAGRFDLTYAATVSTDTSEINGELAGWFSVPLP